MMHNLLARWRRIPYIRSSLIWTIGILLIGHWIGGSYFQSDFRLRFAFYWLAGSVVTFVHQLIYKRQILGDQLVAAGFMVPAFVIGVWLSFAFFEADAALGFLPQVVAVIVGAVVYVLYRRMSPKE